MDAKDIRNRINSICKYKFDDIFDIIPISGTDNNCFFSSINYSNDPINKNKTPQELRVELSQWIINAYSNPASFISGYDSKGVSSNNPTEYEEFKFYVNMELTSAGQDINTFYNKIINEPRMVGLEYTYAAAYKYKRTIITYLIHNDHSEWLISGNSFKGDPIYLQHNGVNHFDRLIPKGNNSFVDTIANTFGFSAPIKETDADKIEWNKQQDEIKARNAAEYAAKHPKQKPGQASQLSQQQQLEELRKQRAKAAKEQGRQGGRSKKKSTKKSTKKSKKKSKKTSKKKKSKK